jgi:hypothetical protein
MQPHTKIAISMRDIIGLLSVSAYSLMLAAANGQ